MNLLPPLDVRQRYTIEEAIRYLRTSRKTLYDDIAIGRIATITQGRRRYVPGSEIARLSFTERAGNESLLVRLRDPKLLGQESLREDAALEIERLTDLLEQKGIVHRIVTVCRNCAGGD